MDIAIHIPAWVLWALGIPAGALVLALAGLGIAFVWCFKDGLRW